MNDNKKENPVQASGGEMDAQTLFFDIRGLIEETRSSVATVVNAGMTMLYWQIGNRIQIEVLKNARADYGKGIVASLSRQLVNEFGNSFSAKNLRRMVQFAEVFPDSKIVVSLIRQLSWTHIIALIPLKKPLQREFYAEMCRIERWSVRTLRKKIDSMLYERTAISKKPDEVVKAELDQFLLEMGTGFAFLARQKRIQIDNDDHYIDLLFFHRDLNRLIAIDLKLGDFKAKNKGQMELYLRWLKKHECRPEENEPLGIILCAGKKQELIELLELNQSGIHVAEYLTGLPSRELLEQKLHSAVKTAKARLIEPRK